MGGGWLIAAAFRSGAGAPSLTSGFFGGADKAPPNKEAAGLELAVVLLKTPEVWLLNMEEVEGLGEGSLAQGLEGLLEDSMKGSLVDICQTCGGGLWE